MGRSVLTVKHEDKTLKFFWVTLTYYRSMSPIMKSIRDILRNKGHPTEHPQLSHTAPQLLILISEQLALPENKSFSPSLLVSSAQHRLCSENWTSATRECKYHQLGLGKEVADPLDISGLIIWHDSSRFLLLVSQASLKEEDSDEGLGATTVLRQSKKPIWSRCTRTCKFFFMGSYLTYFS